MKILGRILRTVLGIVVALLVAGAVFVASRQDLRYHPHAPQLAARTDPATVERGRYLVEDVIGCAGCHGDPTSAKKPGASAAVPLSGGVVFDIPPGRFYPPNITPDRETGIGNIPDSLLARAIREGVRDDGRVMIPFMEKQELSDEDIVAVLSYVRAQPAVHHVVPPHERTLIGDVVFATLLATPKGPQTPPPAVSPRGATVENGRYLVEVAVGCGGCHTQRDMASGAYTGPKLAGARAQIEDESGGHAGRMWSPRNITIAPKTGVLARLTEDQFVARFRAGRLQPGSPMPWETFRRMHEDDLRAMYRYLVTVPPVENDPGPLFVDKS
jgi:mono/diheme cytochrome c family protein